MFKEGKVALGVFSQTLHQNEDILVFLTSESASDRSGIDNFGLRFLYK